MQTINERLVLLRKHYGLNVTDFARKAGIDRSRYTRMETGPNKPALDAIEALAANMPQVSLDWLLTGKGEMLREAEPFFPAGKVNKFGSTAMTSEAMDAALGPDFGEDEDGKTPAREVPKDAKGFIQLLLKEIEGLKAENGHLKAVVNEQREALKESRINAQFLREQLALLGKTEGNQQDAPGLPYAAEPITPIGFTRVRSMYDYATLGVTVDVAA